MSNKTGSGQGTQVILRISMFAPGCNCTCGSNNWDSSKKIVTADETKPETEKRHLVTCNICGNTFFYAYGTCTVLVEQGPVNPETGEPTTPKKSLITK